MQPTTARMIRMCVSAITAGLISAGSTILAAATTEGVIKPGTWIIAGISGALIALKDIQAYLSQAPTTPEKP